MTRNSDLPEVREGLDEELAAIWRIIDEMRKRLDRMRLERYRSRQKPHAKQLRKAAHALQKVMESIGEASSLLRSDELAEWARRNKLGLLTVYDTQSDIESIEKEVAKLERERGRVYRIVRSIPVFVGGFVLMPGQYKAFNMLRQLIRSAKKRFYLVDPWVDETIFDDYLEGVQTGTEIKVLSRDLKGAFAARARRFKKERAAFEVRRSDVIHDRYMVVDDRSWILGPSLKQAGDKVWVIVEFVDTASMERVIEELWKRATPVV
jgi:hypothetical protein